MFFRLRIQQGAHDFLLEVIQENGSFMVRIPAIGPHNVANALAAHRAATVWGQTPVIGSSGSADFEQTGMRQHTTDMRLGLLVIEDCYNANPRARRRRWPCSGVSRQRRYLVPGDMLELGDTSGTSHEQLGALAAACRLDGRDLRQRGTHGCSGCRKGVSTVHAATHAVELRRRQVALQCSACQGQPAWRWKALALFLRTAPSGGRLAAFGM